MQKHSKSLGGSKEGAQDEVEASILNKVATQKATTKGATTKDATTTETRDSGKENISSYNDMQRTGVYYNAQRQSLFIIFAVNNSLPRYLRASSIVALHRTDLTFPHTQLIVAQPLIL